MWLEWPCCWYWFMRNFTGVYSRWDIDSLWWSPAMWWCLYTWYTASQCGRWSSAPIITYLAWHSDSSQSFLDNQGVLQRWFRVGRMSSCHEYSELFFWHFYSSWLICIFYSVFTLISLSHKCIILHNNPQLCSSLLSTPELAATFQRFLEVFPGVGFSLPLTKLS